MAAFAVSAATRSRLTARPAWSKHIYTTHLRKGEAHHHASGAVEALEAEVPYQFTHVSSKPASRCVESTSPTIYEPKLLQDLNPHRLQFLSLSSDAVSDRTSARRESGA